eukprot:6909141-Prymnesium_polylepis.1
MHATDRRSPGSSPPPPTGWLIGVVRDPSTAMRKETHSEVLWCDAGVACGCSRSCNVQWPNAGYCLLTWVASTFG